VRARPAPDDASSIVAWNLPPHLFVAVAQSRPRQRGGPAHRLVLRKDFCSCDRHDRRRPRSIRI